MKIELDINSEGQNVIQAYSKGKFIISNNEYTTSLILTPEKIIEEWAPRCFSDLHSKHFQIILSLDPEIVIMGTGKRLQFPDLEILTPLSDKQIGTEIMDTGAACRSYNFLVGEGRKVIAALLLIED